MVSKKYFLKQNLCRLPFINNLLTRRHIYLNKLRIKDIERNLKNNDILMVSPKTFKNIDPSNYSHCNIWGSGYSAAQSSKNSFYTSKLLNLYRDKLYLTLKY